MIFDCNNYTEEEKQKLLVFFKEMLEGKELTISGNKFEIKELLDVKINSKEK